jgi:hypothetical protein
MTAELLGEIRERAEMYEKPRLFDDLGLVALPTAVTCARLFTQYTLSNWGASPFVVAGELAAVAVQETGILADEVCWSELDHVNHIVVRLLAFPRHLVVEVWDAATNERLCPPPTPTSCQPASIWST